MRRRLRQQAEPKENYDRWLVTYADLITLLLAFFILLYAMSKIDMAKFDTLSRSISMQFTSDPSLIDLGHRADQSPHPPDQKEGLGLDQLENERDKNNSEAEEDERKKFQALFTKIQRYVRDNGLNASIEVQNSRRGIEITFAEQILFDLGSAELREDSIKVLKPLVPLLNEMNNPISVEGHTDDIPIVYGRYVSNWQLSAERALSVLTYLENSGIDSKRFILVGYGEYRPVKPNNSEQNRQANRRVNLVILR